MKRIVFITALESEYGFGLAGVTHYTCKPEELEEKLREEMGRVDVGILVIEERLAKLIPENRIRVMEEGWHGILLVLPSPEGAGGEDDYAERLVRRAIGYHVRLSV